MAKKSLCVQVSSKEKRVDRDFNGICLHFEAGRSVHSHHLLSFDHPLVRSSRALDVTVTRGERAVNLARFACRYSTHVSCVQDYTAGLSSIIPSDFK